MDRARLQLDWKYHWNLYPDASDGDRPLCGFILDQNRPIKIGCRENYKRSYPGH